MSERKYTVEEITKALNKPTQRALWERAMREALDTAGDPRATVAEADQAASAALKLAELKSVHGVDSF